MEETILLAHTGRAAVAAFSPRGQALRFGVDLEACASINLQPGRALAFRQEQQGRAPVRSGVVVAALSRAGLAHSHHGCWATTLCRFRE